MPNMGSIERSLYPFICSYGRQKVLDFLNLAVSLSDNGLRVFLNDRAGNRP